MGERRFLRKKEYTLGQFSVLTAAITAVLHCFVLTHYIQQSTTNMLLGMVLDILAVINTVLYFKKKDKYSLAVTVFSVTTILLTLAADYTMDIYQANR